MASTKKWRAATSGGSSANASSALCAPPAGAKHVPGSSRCPTILAARSENSGGLPLTADPTYLLDLLHQIAVGRVDPQRPPWVFDGKPTARTTPNPVKFDEAFRQIGHRKIGGGPKTTQAGEFLFCGNLGSGILFLRTRVRPNDPHESFYTSSRHRLRDSHVGRAGLGSISRCAATARMPELDLIGRLAQEADTRPVVVRRVAKLIPGGRQGDTP